jgi:hypothetical protein
MAERALTRNAADRADVARARQQERLRDERFRAALCRVLATPDGREVLSAVIERAGVFETVYDHSGSTMYFKEGRRNYGLEWQATVIAADEAAFELLERERHARRRLENSETDARHTAGVTTEETHV